MKARCASHSANDRHGLRQRTDEHRLLRRIIDMNILNSKLNNDSVERVEVIVPVCNVLVLQAVELGSQVLDCLFV